MDEVELKCCECGRSLGMVSEETYGFIGTASLCEICDEAALEEIFGA